MKDCYVCIKICAEISILGTIIAIVSLSSKDPFDNHIIGDLNNYFHHIPNIIISYENICICNNKILNHSCTEENISQGCYNSSSYNTIEYINKLKRNLESLSFCTDIEVSFIRNKGKRLSFIFSINYQVIRKLSISILVVTISFIFLFCMRGAFKDHIKSIESKLLSKNNNNDNKKDDKENDNKKC